MSEHGPADELPEEGNPWTTLDSRVVYENAWIRVREDRVVRPDGQPGIYGVVEPEIATAVVALDDDGCVTLVGQYRYTIGVYSWEVVEGATQPGETPLDAARRELREEAGLTARDWVQMGGAVHLSNCFTSEVGYTFLARGLEHVGAAPEATERLTVRRLPFARCLERAYEGAFTDGMTLIALYRAERRLAHEAEHERRTGGDGGPDRAASSGPRGQLTNRNDSG